MQTPQFVKFSIMENLNLRLKKRRNEAKKKQKVIEVKEIKLRPNIDEHDYQVKMRSVQKFWTKVIKLKLHSVFVVERWRIKSWESMSSIGFVKTPTKLLRSKLFRN